MTGTGVYPIVELMSFLTFYAKGPYYQYQWTVHDTGKLRLTSLTRTKHTHL